MPADRVLNVHERHLTASAHEVTSLMATLGSRDDAMWRTRVPTTMVLDRGLAVGSRGGHDEVRYHVAEHVPGRRVVFAFDPPFLIDGTHRFEVVETTTGRVLVRHVLEGRLLGRMRWQWPLVVRAAHDTVVEDVLDHVERTLTGSAHRAQAPSRRIRLLVALLPGRSAERRHVEATGLLDHALERVDASDAWVTPVLPGDPRDVRSWHEAVFTSAPAWVRRLMRLRDFVVRPLGLRTAGPTSGRRGFPEVATDDEEILTGVDDRHLSFRVSTRLVADEVVVSTLVQIHHPVGTAYWAVVRCFHPVVVRSLLRRVPRPWA